MPSTNGHRPQRAILYARVCTDEQARNGYSLAQQMEALRDHVAREGYEVLEEVTEAGQSGASLERPGMNHVRDLVAAGGVSVVRPTPVEDALVDFEIEEVEGGYVLQWFSRSTAHHGDSRHETLKDALEQANVEFGLGPEEFHPA